MARGRKKGVKNLKKLDNGLVQNQYGVTFTDEDKRQLVNLVNRANQKRKKMLKEEATLPRKIYGVETGDTVGSLQLMGKESDFILAKKHKSLQKFRSREDFDRYIDNLTRVNSPNYLDNRIRQYKRNHMQAIKNVFGDEAKDVLMKIRMLKPKDYMRMVQSDETLEVSYIYDPSEITGRLNQMRASLGMRLKEG